MIILSIAYLRDKSNYKDECYGVSNEPILDKDVTFYGPNATKPTTSSTSYLASDRINLVEPQQMEQSGFVGEAGEVSYDEGLSWHPIQPMTDNNDTEKHNAGISSFDPLDVGGGNRRGILRNSGRRDPDGDVTNVVDCDIDVDGLAALDYLNNVAEAQSNYPDHVVKNQTVDHENEMQNGFAGIVDNLIRDTSMNPGYLPGPTANNVQGKLKSKMRNNKNFGFPQPLFSCFRLNFIVL